MSTLPCADHVPACLFRSRTCGPRRPPMALLAIAATACGRISGHNATAFTCSEVLPGKGMSNNPSPALRARLPTTGQSGIALPWSRSNMICTPLAAKLACAATLLGITFQKRHAQRCSIRGTRPGQLNPMIAPQTCSAMASADVVAVADVERTLPETNFLMIGNPGVGKSTLLNGLVASLLGGSDLLFKSGVSFGTGLTYQFDERKVGRHTFMDTPGLSDIDKRKQAAKAITLALKQSGFYKIIFVVTLENGRVRADDLATMQLVLDAAPITSFGIIVNQVAPSILDRLLGRNGEEDQPMLEEIAVHLTQHLKSSQGTSKPQVGLHAVQRDDDLEGRDNAVKPLDHDTLSFICKLPGMEIKPEEVNDIKSEDFDRTRDSMADSMADSLDMVLLSGLALMALEAEGVVAAGPASVALLGVGAIGSTVIRQLKKRKSRK